MKSADNLFDTHRTGPENSPGGYFPGEWMPCVKPLGQRLAARDFDRQLAELKVRVVIPNRFTALGIPLTEAIA